MISAFKRSFTDKRGNSREHEIFTLDGQFNHGFLILERTCEGRAVSDHVHVRYDIGTKEVTEYDGELFLNHYIVATLKEAGIIVPDYL